MKKRFLILNILLIIIAIFSICFTNNYNNVVEINGAEIDENSNNDDNNKIHFSKAKEAIDPYFVMQE